MRLTRRNALIGLGTVAAGAGAVGGSGAFTSVDAERSIAISSSGDSDANVEIVVDPEDKHDSLSDDGDDTVVLNFNNLNKDAITGFDDALGVQPTGSNGNYDVTADIIDADDDTSVSWVDATVDNGSDINAGTQAKVNIEIDLTNNEVDDFPDNPAIDISVSQA